MINRRELLRRAAALAAVPFVDGRAFAALTQERPDLVLKNGLVITMDPRQPRAEAVAIAGEHILAVGSNAEVGPLAGSGTKVVDLGGKTVTPGFIDGHCHPATSGRMHLRMIDCDLRSIRAIQDAVRERAANGSSDSSTTTRRPRSGAFSRVRISTQRRPTIPSTSSTAAAIPAT